uniref:Uncharacterized protein n=1 Tax=viral metagenome TaxID=1070528 RepID=A0A6C0EPX3_9ZZZZ
MRGSFDRKRITKQPVPNWATWDFERWNKKNKKLLQRRKARKCSGSVGNKFLTFNQET